MKNTFYTIILILNCLNSFGQKVIFKGILYEHNSKTNTGKIKTLQNAQIIIPYSVPTTTDNAGKFKTETDAYKVGQSTKIIVRKAGYEVVNIKDLDNVIAGNLDDVKIYLAPQNLLYEAQMKYYNLAKKSVENSYDKKINILLVELQKNKKIYQNNKEEFNKYEKDFLEKSQKLDNERDNAIKSAQDLSKSIAEINLDFANTLYKRAIGFFLKGEIDSCLKILNSNQFEVQQSKTITNIDKLKESIYEEGKNLKLIFDKDIFKAQIYQSKMQQDSVENICSRVTKLTFKYFDVLGVEDFLQFNKKIISIDPNNSFKFIDDEFYTDFISIIKIKAGKGSIQEAEANRLFGVYKMNSGQNQISIDLFEKSLSIIRNNNSRDSMLVLLNLIDHSTRFDSKGIDYFTNLVINKFGYNVSNDFESNPLYFDHLFNRPDDIVYAVKTVVHLYDLLNWTTKSKAVITNFLTYALHQNNIRKFSKEVINDFKSHLIKVKDFRTKNLNNDDFAELISVGNDMNINSISYLNYLKNLSEIFLYEYSDFKNRTYDNDSIIKTNVQRILPLLEKNDFYKNLNAYEKFKYELIVTIFKYIAIKQEALDINVDEYLNGFKNNIAFLTAHTTEKGFYYDNLPVIVRLTKKTLGCEWFKDPKLNFIELADSLASHSSFNGLPLYKSIIFDLYNCELGEEEKVILNNHTEKYLKYFTRSIISQSIDTAYMKYGLIFGPVLDNKSRYFSSYYSKAFNNIEDFYYGSDFAIKNGNLGIINKVNKTSYSDRDNINYDSLWRVYNNNIDNGYNLQNDTIWELINTNNIVKYIGPLNLIDSMSLELYTKPILNISKKKGTIASSAFNQYGNAIMFNLDYFYVKLMLNYDKKGKYTNNIERLNEFINLGYPQFFVGYSKYYGVQIGYLSHIYYYGIKAAYINNDSSSLNLFINSFNHTLELLSDKNKINLLNEIIWDTYDNNIITSPTKKTALNFNTNFVNGLYIKLKDLLTNKNLIESKTGNKEDQIFEFEGNGYLVNSLLTLTVASHLDSFDFQLLKNNQIKYPKEARFYRNEALYWLRKDNIKMATDALIIAKKMGFNDANFFLDKIELSKHYNLITDLFKSKK